MLLFFWQGRLAILFSQVNYRLHTESYNTGTHAAYIYILRRQQQPLSTTNILQTSAGLKREIIYSGIKKKQDGVSSGKRANVCMPLLPGGGLLVDLPWEQEEGESSKKNLDPLNRFELKLSSMPSMLVLVFFFFVRTFLGVLCICHLHSSAQQYAFHKILTKLQSLLGIYANR